MKVEILFWTFLYLSVCVMVKDHRKGCLSPFEIALQHSLTEAAKDSWINSERELAPFSLQL